MSITKYIRDQELFKTGLNISELIRKIIINYHSKYKDDINELKNKIKDAVKNETRNQQFNEDEYLNIAWKITKYLCQNQIVIDDEKKISVREKKRDSDLEFIIHVLKMLVNLNT